MILECSFPLTLFAVHAHLAVLGIEATACVTILDRIIRRPPVRGALLQTERGAPQIRHIGRMTNWPARAAQMISCPARAERYVEQQGSDKLARSGRDMWSSKAMISWPARAADYVEQQGNDKLARSGRAP